MISQTDRASGMFIKMIRLLKKLWNRPELRVFIEYAIFTAISTALGLTLRYILLAHCGEYSFDLFGRAHTITVDDDLAYIVYYVVGVVVLYLLKWCHSKGIRARSFIPRLIGFVAVNAVSLFVGRAALKLMVGLGINRELAFWLTTPVTLAVNFLGNRVIVFKDADDREVSEIKEGTGR